MGKGYRQGRLGEEIRRIISELLISGIKDPRVAEHMISISGVSVTSDGSYATCYVSVLNFSGIPASSTGYGFTHYALREFFAVGAGLIKGELSF